MVGYLYISLFFGFCSDGKIPIRKSAGEMKQIFKKREVLWGRKMEKGDTTV